MGKNGMDETGGAGCDLLRGMAYAAASAKGFG